MNLSLPTNPLDSTTHSRKRQRSQSMQSSDAASPKRSASEDPFLDPTLRDIRVPEASLPEDPMNISPALSVDPSNIDALLSRPLHIGETWYIVSKRWLDRWRKACTGQEDKIDGLILESDLGPPDQDNQSYVDENGHLLPTIGEMEPALIPQEVWDVFLSR